MTRRLLPAVLLLLLALPPAAGAVKVDLSGLPENLDAADHEWIRQVSLLLTQEELDYYLTLEEPFRREAFRRRFWEVRDPVKQTPYNELERAWDRRIEEVLEGYGSLDDERAQMLLLNGEPGRFVLSNGREMSRCWDREVELEIWFYGGSERTRERFAMIFFRREFRDSVYHIWRRDEAINPERRRRLPVTDPSLFCEDDIRAGVERMIRLNLGWVAFVDRLLEVPEIDSEEWVATFEAETTRLPPDAERFPAAVEFSFPGRNQSRTAVQGLVKIDPAEVAPVEIGGQSLRQFLVTGELVRDDSLLEGFRYRFEVPAGRDPTAPIPLVFQRYIRQGEVEVLLKIEDLYGRRFAQLRRTVEVPSPEGLASRRSPADAEITRLLAEANAAAERGQRTLRLVPPPEGDIQIGKVRFHTVTSGEFDKVTFFLNDKPLMTKRRPPFSVELDLGTIAAFHRLRVVGYDPDGSEAASDEIAVNRGGQRFRVRLVEPRRDRKYETSLSAVVQVDVPEDQKLDRIEIFLNEERKATLYQEPFVQALLLDGPGFAYVRAVAYLEDGLTSEDVVFVNAPAHFEQVEVRFREQFASVVDRRGRPMLDLGREDFKVYEDDVEQELKRFELVRDLSIHAGLLIDTSASMAESLAEVAEAARVFAEQAIRPKDRLALFSFASRAQVETSFTADVDAVTKALGALRAQGSTALYDSLVFALQYFDGVRGQKALLVLSDGEDEASRFDFMGALATAQRAGVTIYVIGLKDAAREKAARKVLESFAVETGGRAFFIDDLDALPAIYASIQEELRSQYLLAYQSTSAKPDSEFRYVRVEVAEDGAEVRTSSGYYP